MRKLITLNYGPDGFNPSPDPIELAVDDHVAFKLGTGPKGGKVSITWADPTCFSRATYTQGDRKGDIAVLRPLPGPVNYACTLLVNGVPQVQPRTAAGGTGMPAPGGGGGKNP